MVKRIDSVFGDRLMMERDSVERESREKETKILSLNHQLEELQDRLAEAERVRAQQQRELDSYANSQDDVGKNVRVLHFSVVSDCHNVHNWFHYCTYSCLNDEQPESANI